MTTGGSAHEEAAHILGSARADEWVRAAVTGDPVDRGTVRVLLDRLHHRPDSDTSAGFHVTTIEADGTEHDDYVVATTADVDAGAADAIAVVDHDGLTLRFWRHPADPALPALDRACDPAAVAHWLGAETDQVDLDLVAYRPLRRAVVKAVTGTRRHFVKVVLPERAQAQARRHHLMADAGVGPVVVAEPAAGVLIVAAAPGEPLAERFARLGSGGDPVDPGHIVRLLDRLPAEALELPRRSSWTERLDFHGAAAAVALPEAAAEVEHLVRGIDEVVATRPTGPVVPVHGDLYEANIFVHGVDGAEPTFTLIDLDTIGPGHRVDDLACVLAHLAVLPDLSAAHYAGLIETLEQWREHFETLEDAAALRARVAGVILTLVAGTTRDHALTRLDLVRSWLSRARFAAGTS